MAFFETLIGGLGTTTGNHRCKPLYAGSAPSGHGRTPALERHTVISSLVRLTCVISLLIDIGPHVLACSSADVSVS